MTEIILKRMKGQYHSIHTSDLDKMLYNDDGTPAMTLRDLLKSDIANNEDKSGWKKLGYDIDLASKEIHKAGGLTIAECNKWRRQNNLPDHVEIP